MNWIYTYENKIYTIVKTKVVKALKSKYPDIFFTMDNEPSDTTNHFPTVYIKFLPTAEQGTTLDGIGINAIISSIQITVTSSKTQGQDIARRVMYETIDALDALRYRILLSPEVIDTGDDTSRVVARMHRKVGANDTVG